MKFRKGDWVNFSTKNWPPGLRVTRFSVDPPGQAEDVTGEGLYQGRGKIVRVTDDGYLIREERRNELVQVGIDEEVRLLEKAQYYSLTLGDLRKFLGEHADAPDDVPVVVSLPVRFNCDEDEEETPPDHPERHDTNEMCDVPACYIGLHGTDHNSSTSAEGYIPPEDRGEGEEWDFWVEIVPNQAEAHDALRGTDHD
jgi:hypothetical protein